MPALSGRLEDPVDDHRVRVRVPVRSNIVPCPFRNECIASIPFNVRYADVRLKGANEILKLASAFFAQAELDRKLK